MDDSDRLRRAIEYGLADVELPEDEDEDEDAELDLPPPASSEDPLLTALRDSNPKSIWKVADHPRGKSLLLGTNWGGILSLKDKEIDGAVSRLRRQAKVKTVPEQNPTGGSKEFFYLDEAGQKRDADLHGPILRAVDFPIDEKMMAPIRAKHRAKAKTIGGVPSQRGYPEFDPNQPRDESGRFGSGGGGSESAGGKAPGKAPSKPSSQQGQR